MEPNQIEQIVRTLANRGVTMTPIGGKSLAGMKLTPTGMTPPHGRPHSPQLIRKEVPPTLFIPVVDQQKDLEKLRSMGAKKFIPVPSQFDSIQNPKRFAIPVFSAESLNVLYNADTYCHNDKAEFNSQ